MDSYIKDKGSCTLDVWAYSDNTHMYLDQSTFGGLYWQYYTDLLRLSTTLFSPGPSLGRVHVGASVSNFVCVSNQPHWEVEPMTTCTAIERLATTLLRLPDSIYISNTHTFP